MPDSTPNQFMNDYPKGVHPYNMAGRQMTGQERGLEPGNPNAIMQVPVMAAPGSPPDSPFNTTVRGTQPEAVGAMFQQGRVNSEGGITPESRGGYIYHAPFPMAASAAPNQTRSEITPQYAFPHYFTGSENAPQTHQFDMGQTTQGIINNMLPQQGRGMGSSPVNPMGFGAYQGPQGPAPLNLPGPDPSSITPTSPLAPLPPVSNPTGKWGINPAGEMVPQGNRPAPMTQGQLSKLSPDQILKEGQYSPAQLQDYNERDTQQRRDFANQKFYQLQQKQQYLASLQPPPRDPSIYPPNKIGDKLYGNMVNQWYKDQWQGRQNDLNRTLRTDLAGASNGLRQQALDLRSKGQDATLTERASEFTQRIELQKIIATEKFAQGDQKLGLDNLNVAIKYSISLQKLANDLLATPEIKNAANVAVRETQDLMTNSINRYGFTQNAQTGLLEEKIAPQAPQPAPQPTQPAPQPTPQTQAAPTGKNTGTYANPSREWLDLPPYLQNQRMTYYNNLMNTPNGGFFDTLRGFQVDKNTYDKTKPEEREIVDQATKDAAYAKIGQLAGYNNIKAPNDFAMPPTNASNAFTTPAQNPAQVPEAPYRFSPARVGRAISGAIEGVRGQPTESSQPAPRSELANQWANNPLAAPAGTPVPNLTAAPIPNVAGTNPAQVLTQTPQTPQTTQLAKPEDEHIWNVAADAIRGVKAGNPTKQQEYIWDIVVDALRGIKNGPPQE